MFHAVFSVTNEGGGLQQIRFGRSYWPVHKAEDLTDLYKATRVVTQTQPRQHNHIVINPDRITQSRRNTNPATITQSHRNKPSHENTITS